MKKFALLFIVAISLTGCKTLDTAVGEFNDLFSSIGGVGVGETVLLTDSTTTICSEIKRNKINAQNTYLGKSIKATGTIKAINESYSPKHSVLVEMPDKNFVHVLTNDTNRVTSLSVGQQLTATGRIKHLSSNYKNCSISIDNTTF